MSLYVVCEGVLIRVEVWGVVRGPSTWDSVLYSHVYLGRTSYLVSTGPGETDNLIEKS